MRQCTYLYESCLLNNAVLRWFFNVSFSSTVPMPPGTLFQLMGPWYANARCPCVLVLAAATRKIFGSDDERSGQKPDKVSQQMEGISSRHANTY